MSEINISVDFQKFCNSLRMSDNTVSNVRNRYHMITKGLIRTSGIAIQLFPTAGM